MNYNDKQLLKSTPSLLKGIAAQVNYLNGKNDLSLSFNDACGIAEFGLALGCQISEADNINTAKLVSECIICGALFGIFLGLLVANTTSSERLYHK